MAKDRDMVDLTKMEESEYNAILRQAVAVIDKARIMVTATITL